MCRRAERSLVALAASEPAGSWELGRVALDGTRVQGNAAIERKQTRAQLEASVQELLASAEARAEPAS